jgi:HPr kinase/phosphorylase
MERVYGTCVAIDGRAVLLRGPSGSGKSDLALRVVEAGGHLVSDDQTILIREHDSLIATCPDPIAGQIEVRGVGIIPVSTVRRAPLALVMDLVSGDQIDRFPELRNCRYLQIDVPLMNIAPFEISAAAKVRLALTLVNKQ